LLFAIAFLLRWITVNFNYSEHLSPDLGVSPYGLDRTTEAARVLVIWTKACMVHVEVRLRYAAKQPVPSPAEGQSLYLQAIHRHGGVCLRGTEANSAAPLIHFAVFAA
jgi:hypothetical protein